MTRNAYGVAIVASIESAGDVKSILLDMFIVTCLVPASRLRWGYLLYMVFFHTVHDLLSPSAPGHQPLAILMQ